MLFQRKKRLLLLLICCYYKKGTTNDHNYHHNKYDREVGGRGGRGDKTSHGAIILVINHTIIIIAWIFLFELGLVDKTIIQIRIRPGIGNVIVDDVWGE